VRARVRAHSRVFALVRARARVTLAVFQHANGKPREDMPPPPPIRLD